MDYKKITLVGRLGSSPEMRYMPDGKAVTNFSVAVSDNEKVDGEWKEVTEWWRVTTFGKQAENCNEYLDKGKKVLVAGKPRIREYTKKDGTTGVSREVEANDIVFLSPKDKSETAIVTEIGETTEEPF